MTRYLCCQCGAVYPNDALPTACLDCGGLYSVADLSYYPAQSGSGIWRYASALGLALAEEERMSLGEGQTPLIFRKDEGQELYFKQEQLNPSGSFKDRAVAVHSSLMLSRGIRDCVEDSSGNAGASLALYSAACGIKARIYVPASASGPKLAQMERCGAEVIRVPGPRAEANRCLLQDLRTGHSIYASHALWPFGLAAYATIMFEVFEQLGQLGGSVVAPIGHGSLFLGLMLGAEALCRVFPNLKRPTFCGVQAENCAPLLEATGALQDGGRVKATIAEGVAVRSPVRAREILARMDPRRDLLLGIPEEQILPACSRLAHKGLYVEPSSALVWAAYERLYEKLEPPIVFILSGSGLKFSV